ncbi:Winged helix-turn-helix DNA-binding protein [uncultured archaeon]|nr:Winged helix-turn-helix DNA-binding protein [uncultured archaeon]
MNSGLASSVTIKRSRAVLKDLEILDLIKAKPGCSVAELAELIGMHPIAVREHVQILAMAGMASTRRGQSRRGRTACVVYPKEAWWP